MSQSHFCLGLYMHMVHGPPAMLGHQVTDFWCLGSNLCIQCISKYIQICPGQAGQAARIYMWTYFDLDGYKLDPKHQKSVILYPSNGWGPFATCTNQSSTETGTIETPASSKKSENVNFETQNNDVVKT